MGGSKIPIAIGMVVVAAVVGLLVYGPKPVPPVPPVLTTEAKAYLTNLALSDVAMQAADSVAKVSLLEIKGKITNKGPRPIDQVQVTCLFHEPNLQVIQRERVSIVGSRTGGLQPGETKSFRLNFDTVPDTWNQTMPDLVIAEIKFH